MTAGRFPLVEPPPVCLNGDVDVFFPISDDPRAAEPAKTVCRACPWQNDCLEFALESPFSRKHGIYGGTTPDERTAIVQMRGQLADVDELEQLVAPDVERAHAPGESLNHAAGGAWPNRLPSGHNDRPIIPTPEEAPMSAPAPAPAPEPTAPEQPDVPAAALVDAGTITVPTRDQFDDLADLMRGSEGHPDPLVRAARKAVAQTAVLLGQLVDASDEVNVLVTPRKVDELQDHPRRRASDRVDTVVSPAAAAAAAKIRANRAGTQESGTAGFEVVPPPAKSRSEQLMAAHGIKPVDVRTWARGRSGVQVGQAGRIAAAAVEAYIRDGLGQEPKL